MLGILEVLVLMLVMFERKYGEISWVTGKLYTNRVVRGRGRALGLTSTMN